MTDKDTESWSGSYPENWKRFVKAQIVFWCLLFVGIPVIIFLSIKTASYFHSGYVLLAIPAAFVLWVYIGLRTDDWKCPRCKKTFSQSNWGGFSAGGLLTFSPVLYLLAATASAKSNPIHLTSARCIHCELLKHPKKV